MQYFIYSNTIGIKDDNDIFLAYNLQCNDDVGCFFLCHVLFVFLSTLIWPSINVLFKNGQIVVLQLTLVVPIFLLVLIFLKKIMEARGYELTSEFCCNKNAF